MEKRPLPAEFIEFIQCLNSNEVRYLLIGGWAVGLHGHPRATKDIDFLVAVDNDNLEKLKNSFNAFGMPPIDMESFKEKGNVIRVGSSPVQIDIINEADGIDINDCFLRKETVKINGTDVFVISREDLIRNKKASGRSMDIADAEKLCLI